MEDASATDLDWFWRGWFYTTDVVDIGVKNVNNIIFLILLIKKHWKNYKHMDMT